MSRVIEMVLPDQLVTDVQPMLVQGGMDLKDYILEIDAIRPFSADIHKAQLAVGMHG